MHKNDERSLYHQSKELIKKQVNRIADFVLAGEVTLPLDNDKVKAHTEPNFGFYIGTLSRRMHNESYTSHGPLSREQEQERFDAILRHIGYAVTARFDTSTGQKQAEVIFVDFSQQPIQQELDMTG